MTSGKVFPTPPTSLGGLASSLCVVDVCRRRRGGAARSFLSRIVGVTRAVRNRLCSPGLVPPRALSAPPEQPESSGESGSIAEVPPVPIPPQSIEPEGPWA
eukprot:7312139-Alexandrium_andersonii.AAC.1